MRNLPLLNFFPSRTPSVHAHAQRVAVYREWAGGKQKKSKKDRKKKQRKREKRSKEREREKKKKKRKEKEERKGQKELREKHCFIRSPYLTFSKPRE